MLGLLAIGVIAVIELPGWLSPAPAQTVWQTITAGISNGTVPKETALEAFAYDYQVDIPGVTVPKGIEGGDEPVDGSGPLSWVEANWDQLTPAQQTVIDRYLARGSGSRTTNPNPTATVAPTGGAMRPGVQLAAASVPCPIPIDAAPDAPPDIVAAMTRELCTDIAHIGPKLGLAIVRPGNLLYPKIELIISDTYGGKTLMNDRRRRERAASTSRAS